MVFHCIFFREKGEECAKNGPPSPFFLHPPPNNYKKYFEDPHSLSDQYLFFYSPVYTLWKFPHLLLSFTTWPPVLEKLKGGAGVFIDGLLAFILRMRASLRCSLINHLF